MFKPGMRTIKTILAVAITIISCALLGIDSPFFACMATIFVIQSDKDSSINNAKNRVWGTLCGAIISNAVLIILHFFPYNVYIQTFATCISIFLVIQVSNKFQKPLAVFPGCIVVCAILCSSLNLQTPILYGMRRTFQTLFGVLVGLGVNLFICPYTPPKENQDTDREDETNVLDDLSYPSDPL